MNQYPNFTAALDGLAPTKEQIAKRLGCSRRMVYLYLSGQCLPPAEKIKQFPELDNALTKDIRPWDANSCS